MQTCIVNVRPSCGLLIVIVVVLSLASPVYSQCSNCPCPLSPFTPFSDPLTESLDNGAIDPSVDSNLYSAFLCAKSAIFNSYGKFLMITSGRRTGEYQKHLRESWDKRQ